MASSNKSTSAESNTAPTDIPINLGKPSLRLRLEAYYRWVSPQQLDKDWKDRFAQIWRKYGGSVEGERQLARKLHKKYGTQVLLQLTEGTSSTTTSTTTKPSTTSDSQPQQYTEEWYELRSQEWDSGVVDFTSNRFDPVAALKQSLQVVAESNKKAFTISQQRLERVDQCRPFLPVCDPQYRVPTSASSTTTARRDPKDSQQRAASCWESTAMPSYTLLYRAMHSNQKIRVLVRYVDGMRGTVTGKLIAYDKHFNLLLQRAQETYSPRVAVHHPENHETTTTPRTVDREIARRHAGGSRRSLPQVLVRGDNVVLVYWAADETSSQRGATSRYRPQAPSASIGSVGSLSLK